MFQLTAEEWENLRSQIVTSKNEHQSAARVNSSQTVMSSKKHRGYKYLPYAFTEQGVAMLSSVLRSPRAVEVNIAIMRTFVQLRRLMDSNRDLARKIGDMEKKYDDQIRVIFDAIRQLISQPTQPSRELGFHTIARKRVSKKVVKKASRPKS